MRARVGTGGPTENVLCRYTCMSVVFEWSGIGVLAHCTLYNVCAHQRVVFHSVYCSLLVSETHLFLNMMLLTQRYELLHVYACTLLSLCECFLNSVCWSLCQQWTVKSWNCWEITLNLPSSPSHTHKLPPSPFQSHMNWRKVCT